jgi:MHS family proline/betaine transporter-like MFS transporter
MIAAGMIGNMLEWYDSAIYGNFAASIGRQFFPREDGLAPADRGPQDRVHAPLA